MIRIFLGNVGSGKTASAVREMFLSKDSRITYSNIRTYKLKNTIPISPEMLLKKVVLGYKKNGDEISKYEFNREFWQQQVTKDRKINVTLDEIHTLLNSRRAMSKQTQCLLDFLALIRRIIGSDPAGGTLTLITQIERRLDVIAKEMSHQVRYHVCHFKKTCRKCQLTWPETNENPEPLYECPRCKSGNISKHNHVIEVWHFNSIDNFMRWKYLGMSSRETSYRHYYILDIEKYFDLYDTLQWDNLITNI